MEQSRRNFLKISADATGFRFMGSPEVLGASASGELKPFSLASVRPASGIFQEQEEINSRYLESLNVDPLPHSFRLTAGVTSTATPYGGWEEPGCELRGHFAGGHFLSAVALAYACSGHMELRCRGNELVSGLGGCQKKIGNGYLSAFPPTVFERLGQNKPWPGCWI